MGSRMGSSIEIVRDAARKPADCFELLRKRKLLFEVFALGDVAIDDHQLFHFAGGIFDGARSGFER